MRDEVEEFLRRAAARRAQAEARRREQQQQPAAPPQQQRPAPIARPPLRTLTPSPADEIVEIIDAEDADTGSRFSSSVAQHMRGTTEIARHASSLGAEVDQADDKLQARLHKTFDHKLGQLKDTTTGGSTQAVRPADSMISLNLSQWLSNPLAIRNAVVLGEILNRPESRWE